MTATNIIPPRVPLVDPRTGVISREWYLFLYNIFNRVGGGNPDDFSSAYGISPPDEIHVLDEKNELQPPSIQVVEQEAIATLFAELQGALQEVSIVEARQEIENLSNRLADVQARLEEVMQQSELSPRPELGTLAWQQADKAKLGDMVTNYTEFKADGTMQAIGDATCFRDELNDLVKAAANNPASHLVFDFTEGALVFKTNADLNDWAIMNVQINHDWKSGSNVYPHIHWFQAQNNTPNWLIEYRWQRNGQAKTTAWTRAIMTSNVFTYTAGTLNQISGFPVITPPANYNISDILQIRFLRDNANTSGLFAGADPYTADVSATSADVHIEVDMLGSHSEYVK